jgi:ribosome-associated protein
MTSSATALVISTRVSIPITEIEFTPIRASGPGGQHINKVSTAIHLRFDIRSSSLPDYYKERLMALRDRRITKEGAVVIKAQQARSQEQNRNQALARLAELVQSVAQPQKKRVPTKPSRSARRKRTDDKTKRGRDKALRRKIYEPD